MKADWEHEKKWMVLEVMKACECKREGKLYVGIAVKDHQPLSERGCLKLLSWGMNLCRPGLLIFPKMTDTVILHKVFCYLWSQN